MFGGRKTYRRKGRKACRRKGRTTRGRGRGCRGGQDADVQDSLQKGHTLTPWDWTGPPDG